MGSKLIKLYKDPNSGNGGCPTVYAGSPGRLVIQADQVDADTYSELENVLPGEMAVEIDAAIILRAAEIYKAQQEGAE
jgi:hypothetical protein